MCSDLAHPPYNGTMAYTQFRRIRHRRRRANQIGCGLLSLVGVGALALAGWIVWRMPAVQDRLAPRLAAFDEAWRGLQYGPQPEVLPTAAVALEPPPTFAPAVVQATQTPAPTELAATTEPTLTPTATATLAPIPAEVTLRGARYEPQLFNNCGPATLTAALVYWGWRGAEADSLTWYGNGVDVRWQREVAAVVKPGDRDKNVSPEELIAFATQRAGLGAALRFGGDLDRLKRLIAAGFPVIIERGFLEDEHGQEGKGWEGHYGLLTGYDDAAAEFITQDSYIGANYRRAYDLIERDWRAFNNLYIVLYPPNREAELMALLGSDGDILTNLDAALAQAQTDAADLRDPEQGALAWHNVGAVLFRQGRADEAIVAFDQARSFDTLPRRLLWYRHEMYAAYFEAGRYQDVIDLADLMLQSPGLEESFYWRARASDALGERVTAIEDLRAALAEHPGWVPALEQLAVWDVAP